MAQAGNRPLSPHIGIWRWRLNMLISISHRATGMANTAAALCLTWWLVALASGPDYYEVFMGWAGSWLGRLVLFGFTFTFMLHLATGVRHLVMDTGAGLSLEHNDRLNKAVPVVAILLTVALWVAGYYFAGRL